MHAETRSTPHAVPAPARPTSDALRARRRRRHREGMTLIEIMIVVIIMALIATAVGVAVLPQIKKARINSTKSDAQTVRSAVQMYLGEHPGGECPSIEKLVEDGQLDRSKRTTDAWDRPFQIECDGDEVSVSSPGPDGQMGSEDDIRQ